MVKCLNCLYFKFKKGWKKVQCQIGHIEKEYIWKTYTGTLDKRAKKMKKLVIGCPGYESMGG